MNLLAQFAKQYGTDKYPVYTDFYHTLLYPRRTWVHHVLEIGIGTPEAMRHVQNYKPGASLRMWRDYFMLASIIGVDKDERVLFQEARIRTFQIDQDRIRDIESIDLPQFDLIIDDGSHKVDHQAGTAKQLMPHLAGNGLYIIEDVNEPNRLSSSLPFEHQVIQCRRPDCREIGSLILIGGENGKR